MKISHFNNYKTKTMAKKILSEIMKMNTAEAVRNFLNRAKAHECSENKLAKAIGVPQTYLSHVKRDDKLNVISDKYWEVFRDIANNKIEIQSDNLRILSDEGLIRIPLSELKSHKIPKKALDPELLKEQLNAGWFTAKKNKIAHSGTELLNDGHSIKEYSPYELQDLVNIAVRESMQPLCAKIDFMIDTIREMKIITTRTLTFDIDHKE